MLVQIATHQIYSAAGEPPLDGDLHGVCRACGCIGVGVAFEKWVSDRFNDYDKLTQGNIICKPCLFCFIEKNETLTKKLNKDKPQKCRSYSHFIVNGEWFVLTKSDKGMMQELLFSNPSLAVIADSGQKHLIFKAKPGWWQFEEQAMLPCPDLLKRIIEPVESLYNAGASKSEIETGNYNQLTIKKIGLQIWQPLEVKVKQFRGGLPFKLAIFLAQRGIDGSKENS